MSETEVLENNYKSVRLRASLRFRVIYCSRRRVAHSDSVKLLKYIELKSGHSDNGPAWIGYVTPSKTGRTLYFNGRG
jgi:hypothetical protein